MESPARFIDHTLLKADATSVQIEQLCRDALQWGVCFGLHSSPFCSACCGMFAGDKSGGWHCGGFFPLVTMLPPPNALRRLRRLLQGASELDMVIPLGAVREGHLDVVREDVCRVLEAACGHTLKVIIECCYLDNALKVQLVELLIDTGASYVKTSTGCARAGATPEDVRLLHQAAQGRIKVKAAGGIRDWASCRAMLEAGAQRVGTSNGVQIMQQWQKEQEV